MEKTINVYRHRAGHYELSKLPLTSVSPCGTDIHWLCETNLEAMPHALRRLIALELQSGDWATLSKSQFFDRDAAFPIAAPSVRRPSPVPSHTT